MYNDNNLPNFNNPPEAPSDKVSGDAVNHPPHYTDGKIEVIEFIEDKQLDFCLGNAVKYISRAGKKNPDKIIEDLHKAIWYIDRKIQQLSTSILQRRTND